MKASFKIFATLFFLLFLFIPVSALGDIYRVDWSLSGIDFGNSPGSQYKVVRLDIGSGERFFPAAGALYPNTGDAPIFPVSGSCIMQPSGLIKCSLAFELATLVIEVSSTLNGNYKIVNYAGETTHSGQVFYTGIVS